MTASVNAFQFALNDLPLGFGAQGSGDKYSYVYLLLALGAATWDGVAWQAGNNAYQEVLFRVARLPNGSQTKAFVGIQQLFAQSGKQI